MMQWMIRWSSTSLSKVIFVFRQLSCWLQVLPFRRYIIPCLFCPEPPVQIIGNSGHPEHHILVAGDDLILECEVSRPNAIVQWLRNDELLKPDTHIQIESHDVVRKLVLSALQPSDSGKYICDAVDDKLVTIVEIQGEMFSVLFLQFLFGYLIFIAQQHSFSNLIFLRATT